MHEQQNVFVGQIVNKLSATVLVALTDYKQYFVILK